MPVTTAPKPLMAKARSIGRRKGRDASLPVDCVCGCVQFAFQIGEACAGFCADGDDRCVFEKCAAQIVFDFEAREFERCRRRRDRFL